MSTRRLAAILVADVVGFSRLVGADEAGTLARLTALRRDIVEPAVARHAGRLFKQTGDGFLVEFASAVEAVACAIEIQKAAGQDSLPLRIGIHVGDVVVQGDDLMGDGVNIAARIEGVAEPGGIAVSRQVHDQVRDRLAVAFEDKGEVELKNIGRPVHVFAVGGKSAPAAPTLALPDKPSIAVLPFQNMSGDPEQEYFADGMVEDIITALSRFKSLFVIARNSSFTYKGRAVDVKQVGRELGVRYVLEGSVRKAAGRVRITGQLIDSETGAHLWADRFDGALDDIFDLQDQVTASVVGAIAPKIEKAEIDRAQRKPTENLDAYDCFLRGVAAMSSWSLPTREAWIEAQRLFYRAMELAPEFSTPYAMAARTYTALRQNGWEVDKAVAEAETRRLVSRVAAIGKDDAQALCWAGHAMAAMCRDLVAAADLVDQGLAINHNFAHGWQLRGLISAFQGDYAAAREQAARAMRLSPLDPEIFRSEQVMTLVSVNLGRYDEAVGWAKKVELHNPTFAYGSFAGAAANALAGNMDEARRLVARILERDPAMSVAKFRGNRPGGLARPADKVIEGLRLAGLPE